MQQLNNVTLQEALHHPNWSMGKKITIDSATMMNKGFEIIEAAYLFDLEIDNITPLIHRESIVHSMVEFIDSSIIAQLANPDMKLPISYAMFYPNRVKNLTTPLDLELLNELHFEKVDYDKYPLLRLAIECFKIGGSSRAVLNAANEAAVQLFIDEKIRFVDIEKIVMDAVKSHQTIANPTLEQIYEIDQTIKSTIFTKYNI